MLNRSCHPTKPYLVPQCRFKIYFQSISPNSAARLHPPVITRPVLHRAGFFILLSNPRLFVFVLVRSVDKRVSQILNGHTGTFAKIKVPGRAEEAQVGIAGGAGQGS